MTTTNWDGEIAALRAMLASGVLKSRQADGKELTFATVEDLERRINYLRNLQANPTGKAKSRTAYASFGRD
ncbi:hypothetical protein V7S57_02405 [Caulobacter sp. CCNWLY153]|uniref:phage head-tail joining protein n=1 Tax=unclassified Caulobacter TaxID=2648921 RepID=UPI002FF3C3C6